MMGSLKDILYENLLMEVASLNKLKERLKNFIFSEMYNREVYEKREVDSELFSFDEWRKYIWKNQISKRGKKGRFQIKLDKFYFKKALDLNRLDKSKGKKVKEFFNNLVEDLDWFVNKVYISGKETKRSYVKLQFEKKKTESVEVPNKLYHVTLKKNLDNVLSKGVVPQEGEKKKFSYPKRAFFFTEKNEELFQRFLVNKFSYYLSPEEKMYKNINIPPVVVLEIDTTKLNESFLFYEDHDMPNAVWTDRVVPPKAINIVDYMYEEENEK